MPDRASRTISRDHHSPMVSSERATGHRLALKVLEKNAPGGQAGSSSRIENYLGFPMAISGEELSNRAFVQAEKFGAHIAIAQSAMGLKSNLPPYTVELEGGGSVRGQTVIIAAGSRYRRLDLPNLSQLEGVGVYYGATHVEATVCGTKRWRWSWAAGIQQGRPQFSLPAPPSMFISWCEDHASLKPCRGT